MFAQGRRAQARCPNPHHGFHRGRGRQALRQHLFSITGGLFQRTRHLRRGQGAQHRKHHRRGLPRSQDRRGLQQPFVWVWRLPPHHEGQQRQLPLLLDPGHHGGPTRQRNQGHRL